MSEESDLEKKFKDYRNPNGHNIEVIVVNYLHIIKRMERAEIADWMGYKLTWVKDRREEGFDDCSAKTRKPYKVMWLRDYTLIDAELINSFIERLNKIPRRDGKIFVIKFI